MSLVSLVEWNVSLGSVDVSWGGVGAIRTAAKETTIRLDPCKRRRSINKSKSNF